MDDTIKLWNIENSKEITTLNGHFEERCPYDAASSFVTFSSDGKQLVSGNEFGAIKLWKIADDKVFPTLQTCGNIATFSPDGKRLAVGNVDSSIKLWDIENSKEIATLYGRSGSSVHNIIFSPDGRLLASGSYGYFDTDHTIKLWDVETNSEIGILRGHSRGVNNLEFSSDGKTLVSQSVGTIIIWNLDLDDLLKRGCEWLQGYLKNPNANISDEDRALCDDILKNDTD